MMKIKVNEKDFVIVKAKKPYSEAFANIKDDNELTVILEQDKVNEEDVIEIEKDWKLITFDYKLEFDLVGFLAKVSKALADEGISIFVVSAYSTDHVLVKKENLNKAVEILEKLK